jgi:hypothetical protein
MKNENMPLPNQPIGTCNKCGIKLYHIMHYVCEYGINCPSNLGNRITR